MKRSCVFSIIIVLLLAGCGGRNKNKATESLSGLQRLTSSKASKIGVIRSQGLRDTALGVGARGGLAWRATQINHTLKQNEKMLTRIFNFNAMLLEKNVLPPVLNEARNTLDLAGIDTIRVAERTYQIVNQARFVTATPTWRDYLWMSYTPPEAPDRTLLPKNREERLIWKRYVEQGWQAGVQQADLIFQENIARIKRDYNGMLRYRTLLAKNMVSAPFVAQMDMGITGGGSDMTVNDRILRITAFPALQADGNEWKTEVIPHE